MLLASIFVTARLRYSIYQRYHNRRHVTGFFGQGMTNLGWTVVSDVAPMDLIRLTTSV